MFLVSFIPNHCQFVFYHIVCEALHRHNVKRLLAVTSGPLHLSILCHLSRDTDLTHDQRASQTKNSNPLSYGAVNRNSKIDGNKVLCPFKSRCSQAPNMEDTRCFLMIPLPTLFPQDSLFPTPWPFSETGPCVLSSVVTTVDIS